MTVVKVLVDPRVKPEDDGGWVLIGFWVFVINVGWAERNETQQVT